MFSTATTNPVLQAAWLLIGVMTVIYAVRALFALVPRAIPRALWRNKGTSVMTVIAAAATCVAVLAVGQRAGQPVPVTYTLPATPVPAAPLANDASAGKVVFTFDDGPDTNTLAVISELNALHIKGVFFVIGDKVAAHRPAIAAEVANGEVIGNHTWDHQSLTGKGTGTKPLTQAQVRDELTQASTAIVSAGAPQPALWRPPYGGVDGNDVATARTLGLRVVLDSGTNIVDSNDWNNYTPTQIAARVDPVLSNGTIIAFHDGLATASNTIAALPLIVAYMNAHHLGATTTVRPDATGGCCIYANRDNQSPATETTG